MRCHFLSNDIIKLSIKKHIHVGTDLNNGLTAKNHRFLYTVLGRSGKWHVGWLERCNSGSIAVGLAALVTDPQFGAGVGYVILALAQRRLRASELTYLALACEAVALVKFAAFRVYELGADSKEKRGVY
jgi:hypothetical protein